MHFTHTVKDSKFSQARFQPLQQLIWRRWGAIALTTLLCWWGISQPVTLARTNVPQASTIQPYVDRVVDRVTEFTLDNGMTFIVLERHQAPVISFMTHVNVGSAYEVAGKTGVAHFLEHLAFKGTTQIGTSDYQAEKPVLEQLDQLFDKLQAAKAAGRTAEVTTLQAEFDALQQQAATYVRQNEYGQIVERAGGVGLNANTSADATRYFYSFPANKLELWMSLESERFLDPVFREFYEEKDVILEERRLRTDNSPVGKMIEAFLETAFPGHPYGRPVIGSEQDIRNLTRKDVSDFFKTFYTPDRITVAIVGDVDPTDVKRLAETYFGRYQTRSRAPDVVAIAPVQSSPNTLTLNLQTQPWYFEGYQRPASTDPDDAAYQIMAAILSGGRTSRLYQTLVEQKIVLNVEASNGFPGDRYSNLMLLYAQPAPGHTIEEVASLLDAELQRLKTEPVSPAELERVKTQSRAGILQLLAANQGMVGLLAEYQAKTGSWRNLFEELKAIEAVTASDIQRVATTTFVPEKLTIGRLLPEEKAE